MTIAPVQNSLAFLEPPLRSRAVRESLRYAHLFAKEQGDHFFNRHMMSTVRGVQAVLISFWDTIAYFLSCGQRMLVGFIHCDFAEVWTAFSQGMIDFLDSFKLVIILPWIVFGGFFAPEAIYSKIDFGFGDTLEDRHRNLRLKLDEAKATIHDQERQISIYRDNEQKLLNPRRPSAVRLSNISFSDTA